MQPYEPMPAVLDRQIGNEHDDAFGHRHFAQALRSLVESDHHQPPFSIGLLGGWGTGKSSIKELYTQGLVDDANAASGAMPRKDRFKSITFNAWRFGGKDQDIKRALLRHVFLELGGDEKILHDKLFRNVTHTEQHWKGWKEYGLQLWRAWAMPLPAFLIAMALLLLFVWIGLQLAPADSPIVQSTLALILTAGYSYLLKNLKPSKIDSFRSVTKVSLPSASAEQYEEMLLEQLKTFKNPPKVIGNKPNPCERLIIFVDDLDRLSAEEMVLGLDAVRAFMEIPSDKLPRGLGLVFVISCDEAKVADALWRGRSHNPEHPGTVFSHNDARRYLDRIFQFRLEIPPPPRGDMRQFALKHLLTFTEIVNDLSAKSIAPEQLIERMIHVNVVDPRNALQIVNAFAQSWWLAKRRESEGINGRPGGLHDKAVTGSAEALAALSAAKVSFPDFYRDLQDDPELLDQLTEIFVNDRSVLEAPSNTQPLLLKRYVTLEQRNDVQFTKIREGCRELRQFLSSLVGVAWPASLQSLLLLSEDPISRKFGAGTRLIHGLLVSGDTKGLIEHLSPRADKIVLTEDQARLLHQMISELHLESSSRRLNAMRVVANLLNDLPPRTVGLIVGTLCTELSTSRELRSMVGVAKLATILPLANKQQQQSVAVSLVSDLCTEGASFGLSLQNMQTPSLDDGIGMAKAVANILLEIWAVDGLPAPHGGIFERWIHDRTISINGAAHAFPFNILEEWIAAYEERILATLGTDYADLLAVEVEANRKAPLDLPRAASRINALFEQLAAGGLESHDQLWAMLIRYLNLASDELKACALTVMEQHHSRMSKDVLSECLTHLTKLLIAYPETPMDFHRGFNWLVQISASRLGDLSEEAQESLLLLLDNITCENYADQAVILFDVLKRSDALRFSASENWVAALADQLPLECCEALFQCYSSISSGAKAAVVNYFDSGFKTASLPIRFAQLYKLAVETIPLEGWRESELQSHLSTALNRLQPLMSRTPEDLSALLSGLSQIYLQAEPSVIATSLQNSFTTATSYVKQLSILHKFFGPTWASATSVGLTNIWDKIFTEALTVMNANRAEAKRHVLRSLQTLIDLDLVAATRQDDLTKLACNVWQVDSIEAEDYFVESSAPMTAPQAAALPDTINWEQQEEVDRLERVWSKISRHLNADNQQAVTGLIVGKGQVGKGDLPDLCLTIWTRSMGTSAYGVLSQAIVDPATPDAAQRRLWRQIRSLAQQPSGQALLQLALQILQQTSAPEACAAVNDDLGAISQRFTDQTSRTGVAVILLNQMPKCPSMTTKANLAQLAHDLGTSAVLRSLNAESLTADDLQVVGEVFGESKEMKTLRKRVEKEQA